MADDADIVHDDPDTEDDARGRVAIFEQLFGASPSRYEAIAQLARDHARNAPVDAQATGWLPLGPRNVGGAVRCIAQRPGRPNELVAGTAQGGIWRSVDDGYSWQPVADGPFGAVSTIAYAGPDTVYAGSGELYLVYPGGVGFFRSRDGGKSFSRLVDGAGTDPGSATHYQRIAPDPNDPTRAWIAANNGLWRLKDDQFTAEALPAGVAGNAITDVVLAVDPLNANQYILLAGVNTIGVARGVYDRANDRTAWTLVGPNAPAPWAGGTGIGNARLAWSAPAPGLTAYVIFEDLDTTPAQPNNTHPTLVFNSTDQGVTWNGPPAPVVPTTWAEHATFPLYTSPGQADYSLTIAVNPRNAAQIVVGCLDLHFSPDGGRTWVNILDSNLYDSDDKAQHADQSFLMFDATRPNALWVCNDGGISFTPDCTVTPVVHPARPLYPFPAQLTPKPVWRKRSFGISAAQFVDISTHPLFPTICGGGLQDNGTFVSFGAPTWYSINGGDGGALGFDLQSPFRFYATAAANVRRSDTAQFPPVPVPLAPVLAPTFSTVLSDLPGPSNVFVSNRTRLQNIAAGRFHIVALDMHPTTRDFFLVGAPNAVQYSTDGRNLATANTSVPPLVGNITAVAFARTGPDMWAGSDRSELYVNAAALPPSAGGGAQPGWTKVAFPGAGASISAIAIHPTNPRVIAITTAPGGGAKGDILLTHDRGGHWDSLLGAPDALPSSPFLTAVFDPTTVQTLYVGTVAGVYVARDLPAVPLVSGAVPSPTWRIAVRGLPPVPVTDLDVSPITLTLRCATYGRGVFEASLAGVTPAAFALRPVSLLVRNHAVDDGRAYALANTLTADPRIGIAPAPPAAPATPAPPLGAGPLDVTHSPDIAVDAPRFTRFEAFAFGEAIDACEMDENLVRDEPLVGDINAVYVQVQNRGTDLATNVDVHLYFADAGNPIAVPDIPAGLGFPNDPPAASVWQRVDVITVGEIRPGEPIVATFRWTPPLRIRDNVALLVAVTSAQDPLGAIPAGPVVATVTTDRHLALHVMHVRRDTIMIRDGVDDTGPRGGVAWGGRSPDISVRSAQIPAANIAAAFADLRATHDDDRVVANANNFVYVRVTNRTETIIPRSVVQLFMIPRSAVQSAGASGALWTNVLPTVVNTGAGVVLTNIPANGSSIAEFTLPVPADPDPDARADAKGIILLAMANTTDAAGTQELDPFPDLAEITDVATFWKFFTGAPLATNAALRALRVAP